MECPRQHGTFLASPETSTAVTPSDSADGGAGQRMNLRKCNESVAWIGRHGSNRDSQLEGPSHDLAISPGCAVPISREPWHAKWMPTAHPRGHCLCSASRI